MTRRSQRLMQQLLGFLLALSIPNVTVYAFAIDNFNRPQEEVDGLLEMARQKLLELSKKGNVLDYYGVRINVVGRKDLLPVALQEAIIHVETITEGNARYATPHLRTSKEGLTFGQCHPSGTLNVMCPYSSREEMTSAIHASISDVQQGLKTAS